MWLEKDKYNETEIANVVNVDDIIILEYKVKEYIKNSLIWSTYDVKIDSSLWRSLIICLLINDIIIVTWKNLHTIKT